MRQKVVAEIRGGVLVGFYASDPAMEAYLVDWDEIAESPDVDARIEIDLIEAMPADTMEIVVAGTGRRV